MNFLIGLSDSYKNTEKCWIIVAAIILFLFVGAIITEVIRKKFPSKYLKINPLVYIILNGCTAFLCPLIFEWWFAIFIAIATIPFIKMSQKTDLIIFERNILKSDKSIYTPYLLKTSILLITSFICYLFGFAVFYILCVV